MIAFAARRQVAGGRRSHRQTRGAPALTQHPGRIATVLIFLLAMFDGAGSLLPGLFGDRPDTFASPGDLTAAARRAGYLGVVAQRPDGLTPGQKLQATLRRGRLTATQRTRIDDLLAAAAPAAQEYLAEAFAAGHPLPEIATFAAAIAGHGPLWLRRRLQPIDPGETGPVQFRGNSISQYDDTTCGSTVIVAARALRDPIYAFYLTTGGRPGTAEESAARFEQRLDGEEQRVHDESDLLWPQRAGTAPWGISSLLNRDPAGLGARYRWVAALRVIRDSVIRRALNAVDEGYPVPILLGDLIPRHWVLLLRHDSWGATFYEPTIGRIIEVPTPDLARGDFSALGYGHLHGAVLPSGQPAT
jgi:hypothetical protein